MKKVHSVYMHYRNIFLNILFCDFTDIPGEGKFRQPSQGQSLINYLSSQDFHSCANLDKVSTSGNFFLALLVPINWTISNVKYDQFFPILRLKNAQ